MVESVPAVGQLALVGERHALDVKIGVEGKQAQQGSRDGQELYRFHSSIWPTVG